MSTVQHKLLPHRAHMELLVGICKYSEALWRLFAELSSHLSCGQEGKTCQDCRTLQPLPKQCQSQQKWLQFMAGLDILRLLHLLYLDVCSVNDFSQRQIFHKDPLLPGFITRLFSETKLKHTLGKHTVGRRY